MLVGSVAAQLMKATSLEVGGKVLRVTRTGRRFRTVRFVMNGREYQAIEQNRQKPSRWGSLPERGTRSCSFATGRVSDM